MGRLFGTDGARGVANTEISCTLAMDIGRAAAMVVARDRAVKRPLFLLGHDTRISHDMLCSARWGRMSSPLERCRPLRSPI